MRRRETRLIIVAYDQLYLVRPLAAAAIRLPWQRSQPPGKMTPARVGPGFAKSEKPSAVPPVRRNPAGPGPGRPKDPGTGTRHPGTPSANQIPTARPPGMTSGIALCESVPRVKTSAQDEGPPSKLRQDEAATIKALAVVVRAADRRLRWGLMLVARCLASRAGCYLVMSPGRLRPVS